MVSGIVVTKSPPVVVRPSASEKTQPTATSVIALSSFDRLMPPIPVTSLLAFEHPIHDPVETIKVALSHALAYYRPIAGRLDGRGGIVTCTGEDGVPFVGASASCTLEAATAALPLHQMGLAVRYPGVLCRDADPLLLLQVTEFSCGGFVVGATWNHLLADGAGMAQFLQALGELARGVSPPSVVPVRTWDESSSLSSPAAAALRKTGRESDDHLVRLDVTIPSSLIGRVREESGGGGGYATTVFEAVAAVLWRCRTRAAMSIDDDDPETTTTVAPLTFSCNVRARTGAKDGYYGNCVAVQVVRATSAAAAASTVGELARLIKRAKEEVVDLLRISNGATADDGGLVGWYDALDVVSWRNIGFESSDFGGGGPARVEWHGERVGPCCVVCPPSPCRKDGGVSVMTLCVKPEHADAFLGELASLAAGNH